jgi:hypothetical protein
LSGGFMLGQGIAPMAAPMPAQKLQPRSGWAGWWRSAALPLFFRA